MHLEIINGITKIIKFVDSILYIDQDVDDVDDDEEDWYWYVLLLLADVDGPLLQISRFDVGDFFRRSYGDWWFVEVAVGDVLMFGITGLLGFGAAAVKLSITKI